MSGSFEELNKLKPIIRSMLMSHRNQTMNLKELERDFKEIEGFAIPYQKLGFTNVFHLLNSMPDIVQISLRNGLPVVTYVTTPAVEHVEHLIKRSKKGRNAHVRFACPPRRYNPPVFVPRFTPVTARYRPEMDNTSPPVSIAKNDPPAFVPRYKPVTARYRPAMEDTSPPVSIAKNDPPAIVSKPLSEPVTTRYNSAMDETCKPVSAAKKPQETVPVSAAKKPQETVPVMKDTTNEESNKRCEKILTTENQPPLEKDDREYREVSCEHLNRMVGWKPSSDEWDTVNMLDLSPEVMHLTQTIPRVDISCYFDECEEIEVRIQHIFNPNRIWLRSVAQDLPMKQLTKELHECYDKMQSDDWCLEPSKVQHGLYCVAMIDRCWYRARIVGPLIGRLVKLFFIDTGLVEYVAYKQIKFLFKTFSNVPAQAIRASLACLNPNSNAWTRAESDSLATLIACYGETKLTAYTLTMNQELGALNIILIDQNTNNINETFAAGVNARWTGAFYLSRNLDEYRKKRPSFNEKYPSFFCIEDGHFPTLDELHRAQKRFLDFEEYYTRLPHFENNGVVEQVSREANEAMVKLYGILSVKDEEEIDRGRELAV
uniref:HTH OST-type domain-containing protein n=1 Tax=Anopheles maculatus TaxID=74869 RepID=A0A182SJI1_9DIPT